ncbi:MAG TPA: TonB-dependent receptor, partial [Gammaproteobacteria bacterium]
LQAQTSSPAATPGDEIVVLGRWDNPVGISRSASQGVVGNAEIEARPRLRTGEILEVVPGLIVTQHSGSGKSNQMFLRGFNLDHGTDFATFVDGMPVNLPTHGHGQGYTDLNFLIPELVERVEYRKGAYYAEVPDFSAAGAAYMSTYRRLDEGLIKVGAGGEGYLTALAADSVALLAGSLTYGVEANRYDGPWADIEEDATRNHLLLRYAGEGSAGGAWNVALMGYDATWSSPDQVPRRAVENGLITRFGSLDTTLGGESSRYSVSGNWTAEVGPGSVRVNAYTIDYDLDLFSNFTYFLDDPIEGDQLEQLDERRVTGGELAYSFGDRRSTNTFGVSLRYDDIGDVGLFHTRNLERLSTVRRDSVEELALGVYYANEMRWNDRFRSVLGLRADRYDFDVTSNLPEHSGTAGDSLLSPKMSLIYAVSDAAEVYLSAGRGFHSNDARGTTITIDPVTGDAADQVDPLVPARTGELGVRAFVADRWNVSAALWRVDLDSELLFIGDAGNTEASRPSTRYGIEVPLYYRPTDRVTLDFEVALTESHFTEPDPAGDEIPGSVDRVLAAGVTFGQPRGLYGSARLRYFGPRPLVEDGSVESDSSLILNAGLGWRGSAFDVRVDILNLLDSEDDDITYFYASRLPGEPAEGAEDLHFHPIEPRTARVHASWKF